MKNLLFPLFGVFFILASCSKDDDSFNEGELVVSDQEFRIDENAATNSLVGKVAVINVVAGRTITYEILDDNIPFRFEQATGELVVASNVIIDFETDARYTFIVEAFNGRTTATATVTVVVNDIPEIERSVEEKERLFNYYRYLALREDSGEPFDANTKWIDPMAIFISGDFSTADRQTISDFIISLNALFTDGFKMSLVTRLNDSNTEIYFSTREQLERDRSNFVGPVTPQNAGKAQISFFNTGEIKSSKIWINTVDGDRIATIKHEILHGLGLGHADDRDSILFPFSGTVTNISEDDMVAIQSLYHSLMPVGATADKMREVLERIL